ncbi:plasma-membrane proton-efflux P-type ATPase [Flavobacterium sp. UBA6031]|uniref:plasma-membrane proton-efflux P-type ATPase n=1 Tax=Flavobacterium sp. UBA6031 TaxID=1946551 RepID=UPI0025BFD414|nr:plasma-membrane proton-efflux P-type ATPase [Flavobacterium sp. UBA6031]
MDLKIRATAEYKDISIEDTYKFLETTADGLSDEEVKNRLEKFGTNELIEKKTNPLLEFLLRYWGPMPWLLELAMGLSVALGHYMEGVIIFVLLTLNAIIGQQHASSSQNLIALLKKKLAIKAKVLRNKKWSKEDAKGIVVGDSISVKLGDIVPADAKIINGELSVDQSALTGESMPVEIHPADIIYSGSILRRGEATCVVINTGANTYFGKTAELVKVAKPKSHQQEVMMAVVKYMMYLGIAASVIVTGYALLMHMSILLILTFVVIFLLGAIPVALPAVLTIVQSVGATELAKKGALVTRLESVEDAASIDIICFDKTGTITQNKLSVVDSIPFSGNQKEDVLRIASLTSRSEGMDLIDMAIMEYAKKSGVKFDDYKQVSFTPFDPSVKRTEAIIETGGKQFRSVKGAAQVILSLCKGTDKSTLDEVNKTIDGFSKKGYRTIAVARSEGDDLNNLQLVGLLPLADPPRPDSKSMIDQAKQLGIKPLMLTGDSIDIAKEISNQIGIGINIIRMADIKDLSPKQQLKAVRECDGFAEIYPEDKYTIVKLLQSGGHTVGMTGDGVNDAPALKQAEMGIAVSNSTDVAKAAASVVLTEAGIGVIIDTITISRQTYQRMLTWVINKVAKVMEFVVLLTIGFFWLHNMLLSLIGVSFLVFANDFVTMSLATDHVKHTSNPNKWNVKDNILASLIPALCYVLEDVVVILAGKYYFQLQWNELTTLVMLSLIFNSQFRVLIVRERNHFWSSLPGKGLLISSTAAIIVFALIALFGILIPPLSPLVVLTVLGLSALFTFGIDFPKYWMFRKFGL